MILGLETYTALVNHTWDAYFPICDVKSQAEGALFQTHWHFHEEVQKLAVP